MPDQLTVLLISDIHAIDTDPSLSSAPSYVSSFSATSAGGLDPLTSLEQLLTREDIKPDVIMCPGDITDRSNPGALTYAWGRLHELAQRRNCALVATVGNHDVDSRYSTNSFDPRGYIMSLRPELPVATRERYLEFWAENFTVITEERYNLVVINTSAFHGLGPEASVELEHGRVSQATVELIKAALESLPTRGNNLLLCHHHLVRPDTVDTDLVGQTRGSDKLLNVLTQSDPAWIVIHGHKHVPEVVYAYGGGNAPVVLGCASFSAQTGLDANNKSPNQVHLLRTFPDRASELGMTSAGEVTSWTWQPGIGWRPAQGGYGFPFIMGFGYRGATAGISAKVKVAVDSQSTRLVSWAGAIEEVPELRFLVPDDLRRVEASLNAAGILILREPSGRFAQIGYRA